MKALLSHFWLSYHEWRGAEATRRRKHPYPCACPACCRIAEAQTHHLDRINHHLGKTI